MSVMATDNGPTDPAVHSRLAREALREMGTHVPPQMATFRLSWARGAVPYRRGVISTFRSLPAPEALAEFVHKAYALDVMGCVLVRSLVNDVYEVTTGQGRYVLKVYRHGNWSAEEVAWELECATHLATCGLPVPAVQPLVDGELVGEFDAPEGTRPSSLTEYVDGEKPRPPFGDALYREFGQLIARLHSAADTFRTQRRRRPFDLQRTLDEPLAVVLPRLAAVPDDQALVRDLASAARAQVTQYAAQGLDWGVCHGDVALDNVHVTETGLTIHDFDLAGERWRIADLYGVSGTPHWDAFAAGYTEIRPLGEADLAALPWFRVIAGIFNLRFHLVDKPAMRGTESLSEGWVDQGLDGLRSAASELLA
jgi:Ser/Thr protein kinase RdoA (MazF antagonist)